MWSYQNENYLKLQIDAMGAIGICRAICFGNSRQQPLFNSKEFPCAENNKKHVINHFFEKLLQLKKAMQTEVGKKEADNRHQFMISFLYQFFEEQKQDDWKEYLKNYLDNF